MNKQIIVNMPVRDLARSRAFFTSLGYRFDPQFSNDSAAMMIIAEGTIHVMLTSEALFASLIDKPVVRASEANEMVLCLTCETRAELEGLVAGALAAGGRTPHPLEDHGFMVTQGFEDLDGHLWNLVCMTPKG
jgi:predicted lactoylglutathione lyase